MSDDQEWYVFQSQRHRDASFPARVVSSVISFVPQSCVSVWQQCDCLFNYFSILFSSGHCFGILVEGGLAYFMPLRSTWLAAISMTLMMKAMAKAQIRLLRTHVCLTCCVGLEPAGEEGEELYPTQDCWTRRRPPGDVSLSFLNERAHHQISYLRGQVIIRRGLFSHLFAAPRLKFWLEFLNKQIAACPSGVLMAAYRVLPAMMSQNKEGLKMKRFGVGILKSDTSGWKEEKRRGNR